MTLSFAEDNHALLQHAPRQHVLGIKK